MRRPPLAPGGIRCALRLPWFFCVQGLLAARDGPGVRNPNAGSVSQVLSRRRWGSKAGSLRGCLRDPLLSAPSQWRAQLIGGSLFCAVWMDPVHSCHVLVVHGFHAVCHLGFLHFAPWAHHVPWLSCLPVRSVAWVPILYIPGWQYPCWPGQTSPRRLAAAQQGFPCAGLTYCG